MGEWFSNLVEQLKALPPQRQMTLALTTVASFAFIAWLSGGISQPEFRSLFRGLPDDEMSRVVEALNAENIPYELQDGGSSVAVPAEQVYEARIRVAGRGLPRGSGSGFELFDEPSFGVTDFVHRVNYARAVQGELSRSIEQLEPVARARVQVVIPERSSVLAARKRQPSASVVVRLRSGRQLESGQVQAIVHLVASSIESLETKSVTVVDDAGRLLAPVGDSVADGGMAPGGAPRHQRRVEAELANRIETILEPVVGMGSVVARVRADMDWTEQEVTEEKFDPDSQVARSEQRLAEEQSDAIEGGAPGVAANNAGADGPGAAGNSSTRTEETINYEISKTISHRTTPRGRVQRLSVAVLVNTPEPVAGVGDAGEEAPAGWDAESLERFENLAKQAVGFSKERGDEIVVSSAPFRSPELLADDGGFFDPTYLPIAMKVLTVLAQLLALVLFAKFVVKPLAEAVKSESGGFSLPASVEDLQGQLGVEGAAAGGLPALPPTPLSLAEEVAAEAEARAEDSVNTIRNWLNQG